MKRVLLLLIFPFLLSMSYDDNKINFLEEEVEVIAAQAKKENKPYFIDFYAQWCGKCFEMDYKTFKDKQLTSYVNSKYLAAKLHAQSFDAVGLSQKYNVNALPAILIFDADGNLQNKLVGFQTAGELLRKLQEAE